MVAMFDGYQLSYRITDSVMDWYEGTIEACCLASETVGGVQCGGAIHSETKDEAKPWGQYSTWKQYYDFEEGEEPMKGVNNSRKWRH